MLHGDLICGCPEAARVPVQTGLISPASLDALARSLARCEDSALALVHCCYRPVGLATGDVVGRQWESPRRQSLMIL